ncbi:hypothetical protein I7I53_04228 [Histoplasma capsulatum var. duboisii H88]|uniref:Uncharacterized protein n=1 Tax=Ajellomyces capsulatus (strain H88) TaxID=544711 RepID=A0A8A1LP89_AJEC8|nr:hypothetical protein I7I53_04228 [Histoplasma capsulatum var. duboisii H88]
MIKQLLTAWTPEQNLILMMARFCQWRGKLPVAKRRKGFSMSQNCLMSSKRNFLKSKRLMKTAPRTSVTQYLQQKILGFWTSPFVTVRRARDQ